MPCHERAISVAGLQLALPLRSLEIKRTKTITLPLRSLEKKTKAITLPLRSLEISGIASTCRGVVLLTSTSKQQCKRKMVI